MTQDDQQTEEARRILDRDILIEAPLLDHEPMQVLRPEAAAQLVPTMQMLLRAVDSGADLKRLEKLMELHERYEANEARKAFSAAMARFRSEPMEILKKKYVDIPGGAKFHHAEIGEVCDAIIPAMSKHGLRHQWITAQRADGMVQVTCRVTHELGHFEDTTLFAPPDDSGKKNLVQQVASTVTYLERYTLLAATGTAAKGIDTDGADPSGGDKVTLTAPDDFQRWAADAEAVADEGSERLQAIWKRTPEDIRTYTIVARKSWWEDMKAKAAKVDRKASEKP
jgi:ERF superfamily